MYVDEIGMWVSQVEQDETANLLSEKQPDPAKVSFYENCPGEWGLKPGSPVVSP